METQTILQITLVVFLIIAFLIWIAWSIKKKGLKEFTVEMIIKAEEKFNNGENEEKMNYVIDKVINSLPLPLCLLISRDTVRRFIQEIFDMLKTALDYQPKKEKGE